MVPIIFSIVSLGFSDDTPAFWLELSAVFALVFTFLALMLQSNHEDSQSYREIACAGNAKNGKHMQATYSRFQEQSGRKNAKRSLSGGLLQYVSIQTLTA